MYITGSVSRSDTRNGYRNVAIEGILVSPDRDLAEVPNRGDYIRATVVQVVSPKDGKNRYWHLMTHWELAVPT